MSKRLIYESVGFLLAEIGRFQEVLPKNQLSVSEFPLEVVSEALPLGALTPQSCRRRSAEEDLEGLTFSRMFLKPSDSSYNDQRRKQSQTLESKMTQNIR